jgi:hypothetical protein
MIATHGAISLERAELMTPRQARDMEFAIAMAQGLEVDWRRGVILPPPK